MKLKQVVMCFREQKKMGKTGTGVRATLLNVYFFFVNLLYLFWLCWVLVAEREIFIVACRVFHCGAQASL